MPTTRGMWLTLVAMTLASSMLLVDQTAVPLASPDVVQGLGGNIADGQWILTASILPLSAFMVLGGRLGDLFGLRRVFLCGGVLFAVATALASGAQSMVWIISMRALQGTSAALMMPTAVAITSAVWPKKRRGYALGVLAGGSAFFAALGPVLGGLLTAISWRLVFLINVPLTLAVIALTLAGTPALAADSEQRRRIDWVGTGVFAVAIVALIYGPSRGQPDGWSSPETVVPLAVCVIAFVVFGWVERRAADPLIEFRLFRHLNFLASTISQVLAGALELGLGYLLPAGGSRDHLGSGVRRPAGQCPRFQSVLAGRCRGFVGTRRRTTAALATSLPLPVMAALALAASLLLRRGHSARIGVS